MTGVAMCVSFAVLSWLQGAAEGKAGVETFKSDAEFLKTHTDGFVLSRGSSQVFVVPQYQGRVMTSSATGADGMSLGWINRGLIASGEVKAHMNPYGGEDRFWVGPEGGQFGVFFPPRAEFNTETWQTPAPIDTEPFELVSRSEGEAVFRREFKVTNWSGTVFTVGVDRVVRLLDRTAAADALGGDVPQGVDFVAYETRNKLTNKGEAPWKKDTGLLSIWILGMFVPSPGATVVIPFRSGSESEMGVKVTDDYFGKVPADRLVVRDNVLFFKADGQKRGKIGINPQRSKGIAGSYDADHGVLTVATYNAPRDYEGYVNSTWKMQDKPYEGDAINSYNDGPMESGDQLGPFYELETSSPALALAPGESYEHVHRTVHLVGKASLLDLVARKALGVSLEDIAGTMPK